LPSDRVRFLSVDEVVAIHERLIEAFGGPAGIRDRGLLESALFRPQTGCYEDLASMAAALFESLLMNHPFIDGNKRVAFFATDVFLRLNGWRLEVIPEDAHAYLIGLLDRGDANFASLLTWIRKALVRRPHSPRDVHERIDLGNGGYAAAPARDAKRAARDVIAGRKRPR
jgi:death-on-curing protein